MKYFIDQIIEQPMIEEVELLIPESEDAAESDSEHFDKIYLNEEDEPTDCIPVIDTSKTQNFNILGNVNKFFYIFEQM